MLELLTTARAQNKVYTYYLNESMDIVPKKDAAIIGQGTKHDSVFVMRFYMAKENRLFLIETFKDSTVSVLHGRHIAYHTNKKKAESSIYQNNMLHGASVKWDSLGRLTDSAMYYEDMPTYLVKYMYNPDGSRRTVYEFGNTPPEKQPDEKSTLITTNGEVLGYELWKNLLYTNRYALRQEKTSPDKYLIYRFSDEYFDKMVAQAPKPGESKFFKTGQDFNINETDINGNRFRSKDLKGSILVINYWFINCPPCRAEMPELNELVKDYKDAANVKFIGIALDDKPSLKEFLKKRPFDYQIVADGRPAAEKYGIHLFPTHVIVGGDGKVYFHTVSSPRQLFYWMRKTINELREKERLHPGS
ncbi:hypothetical protein GCM10027516_24050 [Niabella aquatica]